MLWWKNQKVIITLANLFQQGNIFLKRKSSLFFATSWPFKPTVLHYFTDLQAAVRNTTVPAEAKKTASQCNHGNSRKITSPNVF